MKDHKIIVKKIDPEKSSNQYVITQIKAITIKERERMPSFLKTPNLMFVGETNQIAIYAVKVLGSSILTVAPAQSQQLLTSPPQQQQLGNTLTVPAQKSPIALSSSANSSPRLQRRVMSEDHVQDNPVLKVYQSVKEGLTAASAFTEAKFLSSLALNSDDASKPDAGTSDSSGSALKSAAKLSITLGAGGSSAGEPAAGKPAVNGSVAGRPGVSVAVGAQPIKAVDTSNGAGQNAHNAESGGEKAKNNSIINSSLATIMPRVGDKSTPVFLSFSSAFTPRVLQLKRALESRGIPCWMAAEDMVGNVQDAIGEALMVAPAIIICYSKSYRDSVYVFFTNN